MPKRIYVGEDTPATSRKAGIPLDILRKAQAGQIELSRAQLEKLQRELKGKAGSWDPDEDDMGT